RASPRSGHAVSTIALRLALATITTTGSAERRTLPSSSGVERSNIGTAIAPSASVARSAATQRTELGASDATRSPARTPCAWNQPRARPISSSKPCPSVPRGVVRWISMILASAGESRRLRKIFSKKFMTVLAGDVRVPGARHRSRASLPGVVPGATTPCRRADVAQRRARMWRLAHARARSGERTSSRVKLEETVQFGGKRRQVGVPRARELLARELRVDADDLVHEVDPHLSHELELLRDGTRDVLTDLLAVSFEPQEHRQDFLAQVVLVDLEEQIGMAAIVHQVADALVHGDARGGDEPGHRGDDRVEARAQHVRA